jgi:hypothetical protein
VEDVRGRRGSSLGTEERGERRERRGQRGVSSERRGQSWKCRTSKG